MDIESFRLYCISKKGTTESFPFDDNALVFKVMNKMFVLARVENFTGFSAKCDPERAVELRQQYPHDIEGAWHMNKTHWNSVRCDGILTDTLIKELVDHSYELVVSSLTKKLQQELTEME